MKRAPLTESNPLLIGFGTHEGMTGKNNEDSVSFVLYETADSLLYLAIVADGVGGQSAGELASTMAIETVEQYFDQLPEVSLDNLLDHIATAIQRANKIVFDLAEQDTDMHGMATTIVIGAILEGLLFTAHVGDSRAYLWRDEKLIQLTKDHSWVQEAMEAGLITNEEARVHPNRNIIRRSLGSLENVDVDRTMISSFDPPIWTGMPLKPRDMVLLCSDGLTDMITDYDVSLSLEKHRGALPAGVTELIDKANMSGGRDNITVLIIEASDRFEPHENPPFPEPEPPEPEPEPDVSEEAAGDTLPNLPKVISVSPSETAREAAAKKRRMTLTLTFLIILSIAGLIALYYFGLFETI